MREAPLGRKGRSQEGQTEPLSIKELIQQLHELKTTLPRNQYHQGKLPIINFLPTDKGTKIKPAKHMIAGQHFRHLKQVSTAQRTKKIIIR